MTTRTLTGTYASGYFLGSQFDTVSITSSGSVGGAGLVCDQFTTVANSGSLAGSGQNAGLFLEGGQVYNFRRAVISGHVGLYSTGNLYCQNGGRITGAYEAIRGSTYTTVINEATGLINGDIYINRGVIVNYKYGQIQNSSIFSPNNLVIINHWNILGAGGIYDANAGGGTGYVLNSGYIGATAAGPGHNAVNIGGSAGTVLNGVSGRYGVFYDQGEIVGDTAVLIDGAGYVANGASIIGEGAHAGAYGVAIGGGGVVLNGAYSTPNYDTAASIQGYDAVRIGGSGEVQNYGLIQSHGTAMAGVDLAGGGTVGNAAGGHFAATIAGGLGVVIGGGGGTVFNGGTITGSTGYGVELLAGGEVYSTGAPSTPLIEGVSGVGLFAPGTVLNNGVIEGTGEYGRGVYMTGGLLKNGSPLQTSALIWGSEFGAMLLDGPSSVVNYGVILSTRTDMGAGVHLENGSLTNGSKSDTGALIYGFAGLTGGYVNDTVTNFGTIGGSGGTALGFSSASDTLIVETGCAFIGQVAGGGGTLVLDSGTGTLGLLAGETETVSGSMAATAFGAFATLEISAGATFTGTGKATIAAGQSVIDLGMLTLGSSKKGVVNAGALSVQGGTFIVAGAVTGKGVATIDGGLLDFEAAFGQNVTFTGATGTLELAQSSAYAGTISGFSRKGQTFLDLDDIAFGKHTKVSYSGTSKSGVLTVTDGTHTAHIAFKGNYLSSTFVAASDGRGGTLIHDPPAPEAFASAMAAIAAPAPVAVAAHPAAAYALDRPLAARP